MIKSDSLTIPNKPAFAGFWRDSIKSVSHFTFKKREFSLFKASLINEIVPSSCNRSCFQNPFQVVIKTYGLAIDREVSIIMSPNSERATDSVLSSSRVKLAGLPFTRFPLSR